MPKNRKDWCSVNFFIGENKKTAPMASIWLNKAQTGLPLKEPLFQTWNPFFPPREGYSYGESKFDRPIITFESLKAMKLLEEIQGEGGIYFCGSYSLYGMPLLENGVESALTVAEMITPNKRPWSYRRFTNSMEKRLAGKSYNDDDDDDDNDDDNKNNNNNNDPESSTLFDKLIAISVPAIFFYLSHKYI